jgi:hypothetical protein
MRPISAKTKKILIDDPRMKRCCINNFACCGQIQWHHNLIIAGRQSDNPKHILPICEHHHNFARQTVIKERLDYIMLKGLTEEEIKDISKAENYSQRLKYLNDKYNS